MSNDIVERIKEVVRDVPDFPRKGIVFKDISPIFQSPQVVREVLDGLVEQAKKVQPDVIVGIDSRGFLMGNSIAMALGVPFVMARKKGKLPYEKISMTYKLEYGEGEIEMHNDSFSAGMKVLIHDDLLATGGTGECVAKMVKSLNAEVAGFSFIINLSFLEGEEILKKYSNNLFSLISY